MTRDKLLIKQREAFCLVVLMYFTSACNAMVLQPNASIEHVLRQELSQHNPMVRPVLSPRDKVNVSFSAKLVSIIGVDTKKQMVSSKLLIAQNWQNPFLAWDPSKYDGLDRLRMRQTEVWVPDIKLQNNANNPSLVHESLPLYKNWVTVHSNGTNVWMSLEMIDSECDIDVANFPFDHQTCFLNFSSESYDSNLLKIHQGDVPPVQSNADLMNVPSGEWTIDKFQLIKEEKTRDSWPVLFVNVAIRLEISRGRTFYVLYYLLPCVVLALLMFVSFVIPPDSGERIGFCSSLLLALSVYLLLFSELLPNTRHISLLGVLFVVVFLETALALLATVMVLNAFHATSEVPKVLKVLCCLGCSGTKDDTNEEKTNRIKPILSTLLKRRSMSLKEAGPSVMRLEESKTSQELSEPTQVSTMSVKAQEPEQTEEQKFEKNQRRWGRVAQKLDRFFFWSFLVGMLASVFYVVVNAEFFTTLDI